MQASLYHPLPLRPEGIRGYFAENVTRVVNVGIDGASTCFQPLVIAYHKTYELVKFIEVIILYKIAGC